MSDGDDDKQTPPAKPLSSIQSVVLSKPPRTRSTSKATYGSESNRTSLTRDRPPGIRTKNYVNADVPTSSATDSNRRASSSGRGSQVLSDLPIVKKSANESDTCDNSREDIVESPKPYKFSSSSDNSPVQGKTKLEKVTLQSHPLTRRQARAEASKADIIKLSSESSDRGDDRNSQNLQSTSESDDSMIISRRPRRAAAIKASLVLANDEHADKVLSKLLEKANTDADYSSILEMWRDPAARASLIDANESSVSSGDTKTERKRLSAFSVAQRPQRRDSSKEGAIGKPSALKESKQMQFSKTLESLRSSRQRSLPLRSSGGTLQNRLQNRPSLPRPTNKSRIGTTPNNLRKRQFTTDNNSGRVKRFRKSQRVLKSKFDPGTEEALYASAEESGNSSELDLPSDSDGVDHSEDGDYEDGSDFAIVDGSDDNDRDNGAKNKNKSPQNRKGKGKPNKLPVRRRRTAPTNVFHNETEELSTSEQRERLDYLVEQSASIARALHQALEETTRPTTHGRKHEETNRSCPEIGASLNDLNKNTGELPICEDQSDKSVAGAPKEEDFVAPNGPGCELQPHQKEGISWLLKLDAQGLNAILADEMGLGKTVQAVAFLASLVLSGSRGPHLVIAPKNVCDHWVKEVQQWYPGQINVVSHLGPAEERIEKLQETLLDDNFDIMVTSFEIALRDLFSSLRHDSRSFECRSVLREFRKVEFEYLIVDEAHRLKNDNARMNQAIRGYDQCQRRLLLTGTPLSNNLQELWSLMNILNPHIFGSKATFESWFSAPFEHAKGEKRQIMTNAEKSLIVDRLHTVLRPFFRRRERKDVCPQFASADEVVIPCPLSALQRAMMNHFQRRAVESEAGVSNVLMAMRNVSNHPFTATDAFSDHPISDVATNLVATSGKFCFLHYALPRLISSGHRVLIFSQFRAVLDYLEDLLDFLHITYGRLDGTTKSDERITEIADFNCEGSDIPVFLLTTRAGGVGLNLQTADTVILFDSDWNPSADLQAVSRIQRIGQKKTVHILRLVSENSVDALIVETAGHKRRTQEVAVGAGNFHTSSGAARDQKLRQKELEELLSILETQKYLNDDFATGGTRFYSSPTSVALDSVDFAARDARISDWSRKLLRVGEVELAPSTGEPIWIDSTPESGFLGLPKWLSKDADLVAASRAMRCRNAFQAVSMYDEVLQSRARIGNYCRKDRAVRARLNIIDYSDYDSEDGYE